MLSATKDAAVTSHQRERGEEIDWVGRLACLRMLYLDEGTIRKNGEKSDTMTEV